MRANQVYTDRPRREQHGLEHSRPCGADGGRTKKPLGRWGSPTSQKLGNEVCCSEHKEKERRQDIVGAQSCREHDIPPRPHGRFPPCAIGHCNSASGRVNCLARTAPRDCESHSISLAVKLWQGPPKSRGLQRLQILHEVALLICGETESTNSVVVCYDIGERRRAAVVKVRRVLPQCT